MTLFRSEPLFLRSLLLGTSLLLCAQPLIGQTLEMREFVEMQPQWDQWEREKKDLKISGRFEAASPTLLRLRNCPLPFRPAGEEFPEFGTNTSRLLLTGRIDRAVNERYFRVTNVERQPDDQQVYELKRAAVDPSEALHWHELAQWAESLGAFYQDAQLLEQAKAAREQGLRVERAAAGGDLPALGKLADQATKWGATHLAREIQHQSLRLEWEALRKDSQGDLNEFARRVREMLPGAAQPIAKWPLPLLEAYAKDPVVTYDRVEVAEYPILDRQFYSEVILAELDRRLLENGSNGEEIARTLESLLPERTALAEQYRQREIEFRLANLQAATRSDLLMLAERLETRNRSTEATAARANWLKFREEAARKQGLLALVPVAEDYLAVVKDQETAGRLLVEVAQAYPDSKQVPERLARLGYQFLDGRWQSPQEVAARPVDPLAMAMREGRVTEGMTPAQVEKTLGRPDKIAQAASRGAIHSAWQFGGGLVIHFERRANESPTRARVVGMSR